MNGDHLASGLLAPCPCCQPEQVRLLSKRCVYDALILHTGGDWPASASWRYSGTHPAPPPVPEGFAGKYFATRRRSWTGTMSFSNGNGPNGEPNTDGYSGSASLEFEEVATTPRVWHAVNRVSQNNPAASVVIQGGTSRTSTPFGSGWTPPSDGSSSGLGNYTMTITNTPLGYAFFAAGESNGGRIDTRRESWAMSGATGVTRNEGADIVWQGIDGVTRQSFSWDADGTDVWDEEIPLQEVTDTITAAAAVEPPWDDIEPDVLLDSSDITSSLFRQPLDGHSVSVNLSHSSFRFPPGWPDGVGFFPEQGAGSTFSRARHYLEIRGWGASAARVAWQSRESTDGGTTWGDWGPEKSAPLAMRVVEIDGDAWLRSDPLPEDPLPADYFVPVSRQIRILSLTAA